MPTKRFGAALTLVTLVIALFPTTALAVCSLSALDTVAGLGTEVTVKGCEPSTTLVVHMTNPAGGRLTRQITTDANGDGVTQIEGEETIIAGKNEVKLNDTQVSFITLADRPNESESMFVTGSVSAQVNEVFSASALLRDEYGNAVAGRPMALVSSRAQDDVVDTTGKTDANGRISWNVIPGSNGQMTLSVYDVMSGRQMKLSKTVSVIGGSVLSASLGVGQSDNPPITADLSNGIAESVEITLPDGGSTVRAGELFSMRFRVVDDNNQTVRSFVGSFYVDSTDPDGDLPKKGLDTRKPESGSIDIRPADQGEREASLTFLIRRTGKQTISVYDKNDPDLRGEIVLNVTGKGASSQSDIEILDPAPGAEVGKTSFQVSGRAPAFVNLEFRGGLETVRGESDAEGVFSVEMEFADDATQATVVVTSENGTYEATATYTIDRIAPSVTSIAIDPTEGRTGDPATVRVVSEANVATMIATVAGKDTPLVATAEDPTIYTGTITAPTEPGTVDVAVKASDTVGNQSAMTVVKWNVATKEVPKVLNVQAIGQAQQIAVSWDAVGGTDVAEYNIYIAKEDDPENDLYSIGTKKAVTSATLKDLPLGFTYLIRVTAIDKAGVESVEKSDPASASPLGTRLSVTAGEQSLRLEWQKMSELPLSHFELRYGVEPDQLTEVRRINGEAESFMLRDLLSGVEYFLEMTPIAVNGQTRADLTVRASGTPTGKGFIAGVSEPVPDNTFDDLHSGAPRQPIVKQPTNANTGMSTGMVWGLLVLSVCGFGMYVRHAQGERRKAQLFLSMMQERYHR
ncbi:MAG: fibronectin type III domain-containing protein [Candidatus Peribacteraceae bacterium]